MVTLLLKKDLQVLWILPNCTVVDILFSYNRWINIVLSQVAVVFTGERRLLVILLPSAACNRVFVELFVCLPRATVCADRICSFWWSTWLSEKEPWIKWHLLQRPGYQTANKSDITTADKICLANCRWNELPVFKICELNKKRNKKTISIQNLIATYPFKAYLLGRITSWYNVISLNDYAWEVRTFPQYLQANSSIFDVIIYFCSFFKVGFDNRCAST